MVASGRQREEGGGECYLPSSFQFIPSLSSIAAFKRIAGLRAHKKRCRGVKKEEDEDVKEGKGVKKEEDEDVKEGKGVMELKKEDNQVECVKTIKLEEPSSP